MSRLRLSASAIAFHCTTLVLALAGTICHVASAAEAQSGGQSDSGWQTTAARDYPEQQSAASQWTPVRNHVRTASAAAPSLTPIDSESASTPDDAEDSSPANSTKKSSHKKQSAAARNSEDSAPNVVHSNQQTSASRWQLPNGGADEAATNAVSGNPSSKNRPAAKNAPREPRTFSPPSNAAKLTAPPATVGPRTSTTQQASANRNPSSNKLGNNVGRPNSTPGAGYRNGPTGGPAESRYRIADGRAPAGKKSTSYGSRMWDTINVAFMAPEEWTESPQPDNLPLPGQERQPQRGFAADVGNYGPGSSMDGGYMGPGGCACGDCNGGMCSCSPGCGCGDCCEPACGCPNGDCDDLCCIGCGDDQSCHTVRVRIPKWQELMIIGGVQGFKSPYDRDRDSGNFGFHEGLNVGAKVPFTTMGYQLGYQATQSQLSGSENGNIADHFTQHFVTAGIFKRAKDGIQLGVAWDMLKDERYGSFDFHQLRGELSFIEHGCHEIGFAAAVHWNDNEIFSQENDGSSTIYQASDQYLLFYRFHGCRGGEGRFFGGFNDDSDGIIGADMLLPLQDRWSLQADFTYLIPDAPNGSQGAAQEAWNIGLGLVWHWDCRARKCHSNCYRPLFNVADNGTMIIDDRPGHPVIED